MTTKYNIKVGKSISIPIEHTMCGIITLDQCVFYSMKSHPVLLSITEKVNGAYRVAVDKNYNVVLCHPYNYSFTKIGSDFVLKETTIRNWHALTRVMSKIVLVNSELPFNMSSLESVLQDQRDGV